MRRVFLGIPVDHRAQQQIGELLNPVKSALPAVRWVPEQSRHLTLAFLGDRPTGVIENLTRSMDQVYQGESVFETGPANLRRFPGSSGNIIALVFKVDERLAHLFQLTQALLTVNGLDPEHSRFRPHITLGRMARGSRPKTELNQQTNINLRVGKIAFYQSTLTPSGSIYLALKETGLKKPVEAPGEICRS